MLQNNILHNLFLPDIWLVEEITSIMVILLVEKQSVRCSHGTRVRKFFAFYLHFVWAVHSFAKILVEKETPISAEVCSKCRRENAGWKKKSQARSTEMPWVINEQIFPRNMHSNSLSFVFTKRWSISHWLDGISAFCSQNKCVRQMLL